MDQQIKRKRRREAGMLGLFEPFGWTDANAAGGCCCQACRRLKRACDGRRPCGRCVRRDVPCVDPFRNTVAELLSPT